MQSRLLRYEEFIKTQFLHGLLRNKEYKIGYISPAIKRKCASKKYSKIVFTGMGCSAIVSDIIKGFFASKKIDLFIEVINDYDTTYLLDTNELSKGKTLVIISSYSGFSTEPNKAYKKLKAFTSDIVFLTSGGKLEQIAKKDSVSLLYWKLKNPDREYPLFHAPQYFSILLDVFYSLQLIPSNYQREITTSYNQLQKEFNAKLITRAKQFAIQLQDKDILFLASPKWYLSLLKLAKMHLNEMAMAPAHRNYIHEFGHSEVAILSQPKHKQVIWIFEDKNDDAYTKNKISTIKTLLTSKNKHNKNITILHTHINQSNFFKQFFSSLLFVQLVSLYLGQYYNFASRELISTAAGNKWYNQETIEQEKKKK